MGKGTDPGRLNNLLKSTQLINVVVVWRGPGSSVWLGPAWTLEAIRKLFTPKSQFKNIFAALGVGPGEKKVRELTVPAGFASWLCHLQLGKLLHSLRSQFAHL